MVKKSVASVAISIFQKKISSSQKKRSKRSRLNFSQKKKKKISSGQKNRSKRSRLNFSKERSSGQKMRSKRSKLKLKTKNNVSKISLKVYIKIVGKLYAINYGPWG